MLFNFVKKVSFILILSAYSYLSLSQSVSINNSGALPHASAVLDMSDVNNKGLLIPKISLTGTADNITIPSSAIGLMIYNTSTVGDVTPGFYFWTGTVWKRFITSTNVYENGIYADVSGSVRLGGELSENTNINFGSTFFGFNMTFNLLGTANFIIQENTTDMVIFRTDGNVNFINNISSGEYMNFDGTFGDAGYGFRERSGFLEYKNLTDPAWTPFPTATPGGETMWWYKPTSTNYIRPQNNNNVRIYDDTETYGFYYNGSSNRFGGYFITSSSADTTSAVVGFSDVATSQTYGYLGYNGTYTNASLDLSVDGAAVYGVVDDKNRAAVFGRTTRDASVSAIIGFSDKWIAGYYYSRHNDAATNSHPALYGQMIVDVDQTGYQSAVKGYSAYVAGLQNRGYTTGGQFYAIGGDASYAANQDAIGVSTYAWSYGAGTVAYGLDIEADSAETVYGIYVLAGGNGATAANSCYGVYSKARTDDGIGVVGLGSNQANTLYTGFGDGVIGGSDSGVGVLGFFDNGSLSTSYGILGNSENTANYFYHYESTLSDGQSAIEALRSRSTTTNPGIGYGLDETNQAIYAYDEKSDNYAFGITGMSFANYTRSGGVFGAQTQVTVWGTLGYYSSTGTDYGGYFTSSTTGAGKNIKSGVGLGSVGEFAGAWFKGDIYGTIIKGERAALYIDGKTYTNNEIIKLETSGDKKIPTYYSSSLSSEIYISGIGQLTNGKAIIEFPENFIQIISKEIPVIVTVTPIGETEGIHLTELKNTSFSVKENKNGKGNVKFTWIAIGKKNSADKNIHPQEFLNSDFDKSLETWMHDENNKNDGSSLWWNGNEIKTDILRKDKTENPNRKGKKLYSNEIKKKDKERNIHKKENSNIEK